MLLLLLLHVSLWCCCCCCCCMCLSGAVAGVAAAVIVGSKRQCNSCFRGFGRISGPGIGGRGVVSNGDVVGFTATQTRHHRRHSREQTTPYCSSDGERQRDTDTEKSRNTSSSSHSYQITHSSSLSSYSHPFLLLIN